MERVSDIDDDIVGFVEDIGIIRIGMGIIRGGIISVEEFVKE